MAELQDQLSASSRVEFANYLLLATLEDQDLEVSAASDETSAVRYAFEVLHEAG